jgi:hypothetical protein
VVEGNRLELDGYNKELTLAFEYQGEYHYRQVDVHHQSKTLEEVQSYDKMKAELCEEKGVDLICVPYTEIDDEEYVLSQLAKLDRPEISRAVAFYRANRPEIIHRQIQREMAEYLKHPRKIEFILNESQVECCIDIYQKLGYESSLKLIEEVELKKKKVEGLDFELDRKWEFIRFIEYLKYLEGQGKDTSRVFVRLIKTDA